MNIGCTTFDCGLFEPAELVQSFSMAIKAKYEDASEDESPIERALIEDFEMKEKRRRARIQEIEKYLETTKPRELLELGRKRQELELAVRDFCNCVQKKTCSDDVLPKFETWEDVAAVVENTQDRLERKQNKGKFRQAAKHLRRFCNGIKHHSTVLKLLPTSNQYVSVFYGALATVIQASENYTKIMEALPQTLIEINDAVAGIEKRLWLFDNDTMKCYAWRLYTQIFSFLGDVIRWYTKRSFQRLVSSFNEHLPEFFNEEAGKIRSLAVLMHQEADFRSHANSQMSQLYLESIDEKFDNYLLKLREMDQRRRYATEQRYEQFREMMDELQRKELRKEDILKNALQEIVSKIGRIETGSAMAEILEHEAASAGNNIPLLLESSYEDDERNTEEQSPELTNIDAKTTKRRFEESTRDEILSYSAEMETFFDREQVQRNYDYPPNFLADFDIIDRLRSWATATDSKALCITGTDGTPEDSPASSAAAQYAALARDAGLPVCSYFCRLANEDPPKGRTRETMELTALVYSLIRQLIELLPSKITIDTYLDRHQFRTMEGNLDSFPQALELLDHLISGTGHAIVIFVIDGIDQLDDPTFRSTEKWLEKLVALLLRQSRQAKNGIVKILFTSSGTSAPLFEAMDSSEILLVCSSQFPSGRTVGMETMVL